jgi:AcrR family transcriptional regulator
VRSTRSRVLDAAGDLFALGGVGITMEAVRRKAGVSSGSLRHFFPNPEALARALFQQLHQERTERLTKAIRDHPGQPASGLMALLRGELAFAVERPTQARVHQMLATMVWSEEAAPGIATWCSEQDDQFRRSLGSLVGNKARPAVSVTTLLRAIEGCAAQLVAGVVGGAPAADMDRAASEIAAALCDGFGFQPRVATRPDQQRRATKASGAASEQTPLLQSDLFGENKPPAPDA